MQLKCTYCSTPFALPNDQVEQAIEMLKKDPHAHYDAHCPRCRRANKLSRKMFEVNPVYRRMLHSPEPPAAEAAPPAEEKPSAKAAKPAEKKPSAKAAKPAEKKPSAKAAK